MPLRSCQVIAPGRCGKRQNEAIQEFIAGPNLRLQASAPHCNCPKRMPSAATGSKGLSLKLLYIYATRDLRHT